MSGIKRCTIQFTKWAMAVSFRIIMKFASIFFFFLKKSWMKLRTDKKWGSFGKWRRNSINGSLFQMKCTECRLTWIRLTCCKFGPSLMNYESLIFICVCPNSWISINGFYYYIEYPIQSYEMQIVDRYSVWSFPSSELDAKLCCPHSNQCPMFEYCKMMTFDQQLSPNLNIWLNIALFVFSFCFPFFHIFISDGYVTVRYKTRKGDDQFSFLL